MARGAGMLQGWTGVLQGVGHGGCGAGWGSSGSEGPIGGARPHRGGLP